LAFQQKIKKWHDAYQARGRIARRLNRSRTPCLAGTQDVSLNFPLNIGAKPFVPAFPVSQCHKATLSSHLQPIPCVEQVGSSQSSIWQNWESNARSSILVFERNERSVICQRFECVSRSDISTQEHFQRVQIMVQLEHFSRLALIHSEVLHHHLLAANMLMDLECQARSSIYVRQKVEVRFLIQSITPALVLPYLIPRVTIDDLCIPQAPRDGLPVLTPISQPCNTSRDFISSYIPRSTIRIFVRPPARRTRSAIRLWVRPSVHNRLPVFTFQDDFTRPLVIWDPLWRTFVCYHHHRLQSLDPHQSRLRCVVCDCTSAMALEVNVLHQLNISLEACMACGFVICTACLYIDTPFSTFDVNIQQRLRESR